MNERPYASLSSGLLARKGSAKPAMRPQGFGGLEDLGWNDMGYSSGERPQAAPPPEHVPSSIAALTPAPKITRTSGGSFDEHGDDGHEEAEADGFEPAEPVEAAEDEPVFEEPVAFEEPAAVDEPVAFEEQIEAETFDSEPFEAEPIEPNHIEIEQIEPEQVEAELLEAPESFETPPVVTQQRAIIERFEAEPEPEAPAAPRAAHAEVVPLPQRRAAPGTHKAAFTLRLDADRHLRLRLACAVTGHSAQQIVARALEEALAGIPEIEALASQVPAKGRAGAKK
jgi:hypothetical protein